MTQEVLKAVADAFGDFDKLIADHTQEMTRHVAHMEFVRTGQADPYPAPQAHPLITACVRQVGSVFIPDYKIVDTLKVAPGELRQRQDQLLQQISQAEHNAICAVLPRGKWRAHDLRHSDIIRVDNKRFSELRKIDPSLAEVDVLQLVLDGRSKEDAEFISKHEERRTLCDKIGRHAARLMSEVEDLTEANLHEWKMEPFPGGLV